MDPGHGSKSASSVETSVTKLLISTKQLLQVLTQWSKGKVSERDVSDVYVQLGNDFKLVSRHFTHAGIGITDLGDVPKELRKILELALRETASEETLNRYLPQIREIIVKLLERLKIKQATLKLNRNEDSVSNERQIQRSSVSSTVSSTTSLGHSRSSTRDTTSGSSRSSSLQIEPDRVPPATIQLPKNSEADALEQLKKGNNLQRRASKRFSAYHMAKLANHTTPDTPTTPYSKDLTVPISSVDVTVSKPERTHSRISSAGSVDYHPINSEADFRKDNGHSEQITVFLKLGDKVKRCLIRSHLSFNELRLLFVEKFAYSPGSDNFPDIYIREPQYDAFYELEDAMLQSIQDGTIFKLQINTKSFEEQLHQLQNEIIKQQATSFQSLKNFILQGTTVVSSPATGPKSASSASTVVNSNIRKEIAMLKHEITVLKQIHSNQKKALQATVTSLAGKLEKFQTLSIVSEKSANREYMEKSQSKLSEVSDSLLSKVDDLQDIIEALRKDVAIRGARPSKKKIDSVSAELKSAKVNLESMTSYIEAEKPNWKRIWEAELDRVCEEQQFMNLQEDLAFDLQEDLKKVLETFDLVKMCCEQQEKGPKKNKSNPILPVAKPGTYNMIRDQVLHEVQSLHPDHESRLEAIRRAERLREKEREYRDNEAFEDELGNFVEKGAFKKAGGIEEIERLRKQKDEENLRVNFGMT